MSLHLYWLAYYNLLPITVWLASIILLPYLVWLASHFKCPQGVASCLILTSIVPHPLIRFTRLFYRRFDFGANLSHLVNEGIACGKTGNKYWNQERPMYHFSHPPNCHLERAGCHLPDYG